jgi:malate synthase
MEDLATLEISRAQTWQWLRHQVELEDGPRVTRELVGEVFRDELEKIEGEIRTAMQSRPEASVQAEISRYAAAAADAQAVFTEEEFRPFLCMSSDLVGM